jgi:hypothetical protein
VLFQFGDSFFNGNNIFFSHYVFLNFISYLCGMFRHALKMKVLLYELPYLIIAKEMYVKENWTVIT